MKESSQSLHTSTSEEQNQKNASQESGNASPINELAQLHQGHAPRDPVIARKLASQMGNASFIRHVIQRQPPTTTTDASTTTTTAAPDPAIQARLEQILGTGYHGGGTAFDFDYNPDGGAGPDARPIHGNATAVLKIHITFRDFDRATRRQAPYNTMRWTREDREEFTWKDGEKDTFRQNLAQSISDGWAGQHMLACTTPGFEELVASLGIDVQIVADPEEAHNKMTALKIPSRAPRFRSFVAGDESTLDWRDPTQEETRTDSSPLFIRQIKPFALGSAELTPDLTSQLDAAIGGLRELQTPGQEANGLGPDKITVFRGRASTPGSRGANERLATERAHNVETYVESAMGWTPQLQARGVGEEDATDEERFQRVDIEVVNFSGDAPAELSQNVAAHEAGHMFGLGDEYVDEEEHRLTGDEPDHFEDVKAEFGVDEANAMLAQDGGSMMSGGSEVRPGHYTPFIQQIESLTSLQWTAR